MSADTVAGSGKSMDNTGIFSAVPKINEGLTMHSFGFTPRTGSSKLLIETPPIPVEEVKNIADDFRIVGKARMCMLR